jgi:hypothetical protein
LLVSGLFEFGFGLPEFGKQISFDLLSHFGPWRRFHGRACMWTVEMSKYRTIRWPRTATRVSPIRHYVGTTSRSGMELPTFGRSAGHAAGLVVY